MSSFRTFAEWQTIKELNLSSRAFEVAYEDALEDPSFAYPLELHGLWLLMPGEIPHFDEVKPAKFGTQILPSMFIMDVLDGGEDFRWRLFGTDHAKRFGGEVTGRRMSAVAKFETSAASSLEFARECYRSRKPVFFKTEYFDELHTVRRTYTVALPLLGKDDRIERLFGCSVWI